MTPGSTEAKIKHTALDLTQFKALVESLEQFNFTSLCDQGHNLIAEHIRNRRLLEAGERLAEQVIFAIGYSNSAQPNEAARVLSEALAAYQEAAK